MAPNVCFIDFSRDGGQRFWNVSRRWPPKTDTHAGRLLLSRETLPGVLVSSISLSTLRLCRFFFNTLSMGSFFAVLRDDRYPRRGPESR